MLETIVTEPKKRQKHNYIDNKMFYQAFVDRRHQMDIAILDQVKNDPIELKKRESIINNAATATEDTPVEVHKTYFELYKRARKTGLKLPQVTNYVGDCFLKLSENFSKIQNSQHSYYKYPFRDEMISDAVINCLRYVDSFDVYRSKNPFGFFTTCIHHSFVYRIHKERKELATKQRLIKNFDIEKICVQGHDDKDIIDEYIEQIKSYTTGVDYSDYYDTSPRTRKSSSTTKIQTNSLSDFMNEQEIDTEIQQSIDVMIQETIIQG